MTISLFRDFKSLEPAVDELKFAEAMNSSAVTAKLNAALKLSMRAGLRAIPAVLVNGKYMIHGESE